MSFSPFRASLSRPHAAPRSRLVRLLDRKAAQRLVVVQAGSGWAKTTVLADWVSSHDSGGAPTAWLTASDVQIGPEFLWTWIFRTLEQAGLLSEHAPVDQAGPEPMPRTLLLAELRRLPQAVTLIIDDCDSISDPDAFDGLLWLAERTDKLHLIISTSSFYPAASALTAARLEPAIITSRDLAYTPSEVLEAAAAQGVQLGEAAAEQIVRQLAGWPQGVRLVLATLKEDASAPTTQGRVHSALVQVAQLVVARVTTSLAGTARLRYLQHCSVAEVLAPSLASSLGGDPDYGLHLEWVLSEGLAQRELNGSVRLIPIVRAGLEAELDGRDREQAIALRRAVGSWACQTGEVLTALRMSAHAPDWELLTRVVKLHITTALRLHPGTLQAVLRTVPMNVMSSNPLLVAAYTLTLNADDVLAMEHLRTVAKASATLSRTVASELPLEERLWGLSCRMALERLAGEYLEAAKAADELMDCLPEAVATHPELAETLSTLRIQTGITYVFVGRFADALHTFESEEFSEHAWHRIRARCLMAVCQALRGDMRECRQLLEGLRDDFAPMDWRNSYGAIGYHLAESLMSLEVFDLDGAERHLQALDTHRKAVEYRPLVLRIEMMITLARREPMKYLDRASTMAHPRRAFRASTPLGPLLAVGRADLLLAAGYPERALEALNSSGLSTQQVSLGRARIELARNRPIEASTLVEALIWDTAGLPRNRVEALLIRAISLERVGYTTGALECLERALALLDENHLRRPLMMVSRHELRPILQRLGSWQGRAAEDLLEGVPDVFPSPSELLRLSPRESIVLDTLSRVATTEAVAERLFVSTNTVKSQLRSIYRKLGASSREEALAIARERGLLPSRSSGRSA